MSEERDWTDSRPRPPTARMPVQLRKRKAPQPPPAPAPAAKKKKPKAAKAKTEKAEPEEKKGAKASKTQAAAPPAAASAAAPAIGDIIPLDAFGGTIETNEGEKTSLKKLLDSSKSGLVLFTYPKASTPGCASSILCPLPWGFPSNIASFPSPPPRAPAAC